VPGVVVIGDAAHAVGPESGLGAGLGLGDAHALAIAVERNPDDPDKACRDYETWRRPAVDPYLAMGAAGARIVRGGERPPEERWPPPEARPA
jgi:2-polyprenyl-6-methoxyphenol hydroxylase-like FAD-dependent oxidoreductase